MFSGGVRINAHAVLSEAIDLGIRLGWQRAHKHAQDPDPEHVQYCIENAIWIELGERLIFDE